MVSVASPPNKMNRKAFELTVSAIVLFILGFLVLIGLVYLFTQGTESFNKSTKPFLDSAQVDSIRLACSNACDTQNKLTYCCEKYEIDKEEITCEDERLEVSCSLDCQNYKCESN